MSRHLAPQDFVDAVDLTLSLAKQAHLDSCERCLAELRDLERLANDVKGVSVPEPSPVFWQHFSAEVQARTADAERPRRNWWTMAWRPLGPLAPLAVVACLVVAVVVAQKLPRPLLTSETRLRTDAAVAAAGSTFDVVRTSADDESLRFVAEIAASASPEDLQIAAQPNPDATDAMVEQLTTEQRAELKRLLTAAMSAER
jgi:hypothetical protein